MYKLNFGKIWDLGIGVAGMVVNGAWLPVVRRDSPPKESFGPTFPPAGGSSALFRCARKRAGEFFSAFYSDLWLGI
jgi:hypothetical protein